MSNRKLAVAGSAFVVFLLAGIGGVYDSSLGIVLQGLALGTGTGLVAVGLVLVYRTTRVINFAYGAMGTVPGALATGLTLGTLGLSWFVSVPVALAAGVGIGVAVERLVVRRFAHSPRLVLTVATIGLAQALGGLALFLPSWLGADALNPGFTTRLSSFRLVVRPVTLDGNHLLLAALAPVALLGLLWFLERTEAGTALRGMADNLDRARLQGVPVDRLNLLLWGVAGGLVALAVVLRAPTQGLTVDAAAGPTLLLAPLAAAVVVGMRSVPAAFLAGLAIEVLDQLVQINLGSRTWTYVVLLVVIVVGLFLQEKQGSKFDADGSWAAVGLVHRLPPRLASLPELRLARLGLAALVGAVLVAIPLLGTPSQVNYATVTLIFALAAISLVVLTGWGGVVSLGQVALVGVGGVVAANLVADLNLDLLLTIGLAGLAGGVVAALIGVPALRVSGQLLAVTTLAFAVVMQVHVINPANYERAIPGDFDRPALFGRIDLADERWLYVFVLAVVAGAGLAVANMRRARTGRVVSATRDNANAAAAAGIDTVRTRITAFVVSGMVAGVAGALHAVTLRGIGVDTYEASDSLLLFSMAVIGGVGSIGGALAGVALVQWLGYAFPSIQLLVTGVGLLAILMVLPGGLRQGFELLRDRVARHAARRHGVAMDEELDSVDIDLTVAERPPPVSREFDLTPRSTGREAPVLLDCDGIETGYGSLQVLFGIDARVTDGEVLALLGTNGSGKSTLFKAIAGLLPVWSGRVTFDGHDITNMATEKIAALGLTMMPGGRGVFPSLTVQENLRLSAWMIHHDRPRAQRRCNEMLEMFPILLERWHEAAANLSGGEQQQLSIAMAFMTEPKAVLIDELSLGLAPTVVSKLVEKLKALQDRGTTVVVIEQSVNVALLMCEQALFLEKGQVRFRGPTDRLLDRPDILRSVFIGEAPTAAGDDGGAVDRPHRGVVLECRGLTKHFGGITAVDAVDLTVAPGRILGVTGHNGAGKTTLFDLITGFVLPSSGEVLVDGFDISFAAPHERAVLELGRSFQEATLYPSLTVTECLQVALERHLANRDPVAAALALPASTASERAAAVRAEELVSLLGLEAFRHRPVGELSTGTRRILELGCLLAQDPAVVLLDEPTAGVAQAEAEALAPMIRRVQADTGCSLVVIEHDMVFLASLCDELVAMAQGRIIARGTPSQVLTSPAVVASYLGTEEDVIRRSGRRRPRRRPVGG